MNLSILIGIIGIIISVFIGLTTFFIADRRSRRGKWQQARETVARELSKTLGEGNIPNHEIISSTIRSVLRSHNPGAIDAISVEEIIDDLIRQITSDPFLDSEKRKELQDRILTIKNESITKRTEVSDREVSISVGLPGLRVESKLPEKTSIISLFLGIISSLIAGIGFFSIDKLINFFKDNSDKFVDLLLPFLGSLITLVIAIISLLISYRKKK